MPITRRADARMLAVLLCATAMVLIAVVTDGQRPQDAGAAPAPAVSTWALPHVVGTWVLEDPLPVRRPNDGAVNPIRLAIGPGGAVMTQVANHLNARIDVDALRLGHLLTVGPGKSSMMIAGEPWDEIERLLSRVLADGRVVEATEETLVLETVDGETLRFRRDAGDASPADGDSRR